MERGRVDDGFETSLNGDCRSHIDQIDPRRVRRRVVDVHTRLIRLSGYVPDKDIAIEFTGTPKLAGLSRHPPQMFWLSGVLISLA